MPKMPLMGDSIRVGRCYGMIIGGKLIVAKVIQIYPLDISVGPKPGSVHDRKSPVMENIVRWAWRDAAGPGTWTESPGWLLPAFAFAVETEVACDGLNFS
jgi:hypothetical protein